MKKAILTVLAMLMLIIPAYAADDNGDSATTANTYLVYDFAGLQNAVEKANDGDIIELQNPIKILESIKIGSVDKHITIQLKKENFDSYYPIFEISGTDIRIELKNITFDCQYVFSRDVLYSSGGEVLIDKCIFKNINTDTFYVFDFSNNLDEPEKSILISDSSFETISGRSALIKVAQNCNMTISGCTFSDMRITYRTLIVNEGTTSLGENHFQENTVNNCYSTVDSRGTLYLDTDMSNYAKYYGYKPKGWYRIDGEVGIFYDEPEKIETDTIIEPCNIVFFTDEPKEEDSEDIQQPQEPGDQTENGDTKGEDQSPQEPAQPSEGENTDNPTDNPDNIDSNDNAPQEPAQPPKDDGDDDTTDTPSKEPEQPTEPPQDDNTDDVLDEGQDTPQPPQPDSKNESDENPEQSVNPPQEQTQPEDGENEDDPADDPSDSTKAPVEPPQDTSDQDKDNPSDNPDSTPDTPEKPSDSNNGEDDSSPSTGYRPSHRPTRPSTSGTTPAETDQPQEKTDNDTPAPKEQQLACNGAVIDASRTVVLLGYGDGLLHEDDPLTRAQMATIVFRLLDEDSIASYSNARSMFIDVTADAWYTPYINAIAATGIVNGIGGEQYDPDGLLTWGQTLTIISRFVEPQEYTLRYIQYDGWATQAIQTAVALDWIEDRADFDPDAVIGRGELAELVNSVLELYRI